MSVSSAELLLRCLRSEAPDESLDEAAWSALVELATEQRVSSLLLHHLRHGSGAMPPSAQQELNKQSRAIAVRSLAFRRDLAGALSALARGGVPTIVLKGGHLFLGVYANGAAREMNDLDLLVPADRGSDAAEALKGIGYRFGEALAPDHHRHLPRLSKPATAPIEVHTTLSAWPALSASALEGVWERAQPAALGMPGLTLCPEDLVLHLSLHAAYAHSGEFGLRPLCDLREIARAFPAMDWDVVCARAAEWKCARGTFLMLYQAHHCLGAAVPSFALDRLKPPDFDHELAKLVATHLFTRKALSMAVTVHASRPFGFASFSEVFSYVRSRLMAVPSPHQQTGPTPSSGWRLFFKRIASLVRRYRWLPASLATGGATELTALIRRRHRIVRFLEVEAGRWPEPS